jgi:hypothetical protein
MTEILDTKFIAYAIWGFGTLVVYGLVLYRAVQASRRSHDRRGRRDVLGALALFLTALGAFLAITLVLFGEAGTTPRGFAVAVALGAFSAAGLVMATDKGV